MVKNRELSNPERSQIVGLHKGGHSQRDIENILKIPRSTIQSILRKWFVNDSTKNLPRCGRPKKLSDRDLRSLKTTLKKNRWSSLATLTNQFNQNVDPRRVSPKTVSRRLHEMGYYSRIPKRKPLISNRNRKQRLVFYNTHKNWTLSQWKNIIWSDESRFTLFNNDGRLRVWRHKGERYNSDCIINTVKGDGGSIMIWGCFCYGILGPCIVVDSRMNSTVYIDHVLKPFYNLFFSRLVKKMPNIGFMQDNAPCHTSSQTRKWLDLKKIKLLKWPPQSPDMNPIESLWDILQHRINSRTNHPKNLKDLKEILQEEWKKLPVQTLCQLIEGIPKRLEALKQAKGLQTKY